MCSDHDMRTRTHRCITRTRTDIHTGMVPLLTCLQLITSSSCRVHQATALDGSEPWQFIRICHLSAQTANLALSPAEDGYAKPVACVSHTRTCAATIRVRLAKVSPGYAQLVWLLVRLLVCVTHTVICSRAVAWFNVVLDAGRYSACTW